jgi:hypothetical protein
LNGEILFPNTSSDFTTDLNPTTKSTTTPTFSVASDRMRDNGKTKKTAKSACNDATRKSLIYLFTGPCCAPTAGRNFRRIEPRSPQKRNETSEWWKRFRSRTTFLTLLETFRRIGRVRFREFRDDVPAIVVRFFAVESPSGTARYKITGYRVPKRGISF